MLLSNSAIANAIENEKDFKNIQYNNFLVKGIYYNENMKLHEDGRNFVKDTVNIHENKHGYRSPEFTKNVDYLFSGCSVTYGTGLEEKDIWYKMLAKDIGCSYSSVACAGDSVVAQVLKIFANIKEFGNPKNLVCLFPDFDRFLIYSNKDLLITRSYKENFDQKKYNWATSENENAGKLDYLDKTFKANDMILDVDSRPSYFKSPLIAEEVINQETSHMYAAQYINILSQYCDIAGINFIWSTWDPGSAKIIKKIKNNSYFKEYIDMESECWDFDPYNKFDNFIKNNEKLNCHQEFADHDTFNFAKDVSMGIQHAHHGFHRHLHYYEKFKEAIIK
jgi:hypothetical protein